MSLQLIIIILLLAALCAFSVIFLIKEKKKRKSKCGENARCSGCPCSDICHNAENSGNKESFKDDCDKYV